MPDLMNIGASGLRAYSSALATVGDNIANAQTAGYARRTVRLREAPAAGDIILSRNSIRPGGVEIDGLSRSVDSWLIDDARISSGDSNQAATRLNWIQAAERGIADDGDSVGTRLTAMFNITDELASDPTSQPLRQQFLLSVEEIATGFRQTASALSHAATGVAGAAAGEVTQLNTDLNALERVNEGLRRCRPGSSNEATLLDERDRSLDAVASRLPVTTSFDARGAATVRIAGTGDALIDSGSVATVAAVIGADGRVAFTLTSPIVAAITPSSGSLAGLTDASHHIADLRTDVDALAGRVASELNAAHQAGFDANSNPGAALLAFGGSAASLTALALAPSEVAAADASSANGNVLGFANLRGPSGVEIAWAGIASAQSQSTASARAQDAAANTRNDGAAAARDSISEVDIDREAADLLRFQQAYEAAARTIQVARETMQSILNIF